MASYNQNFMILTLLISLLCLIAFTHGADNDTLVKKMCGATNAPNVCISCIESDGKDAKTDVDVIQQMLGCLVNDATQLEKDVNKIINDVKTDSKTKETLQNCNPFILAMIDAIGKLNDVVSKRKFSDARTIISNKIFGNLSTVNFIISTAVSTYGITIPPPVFSGIFNVEADYKISDQLIASVKA